METLAHYLGIGAVGFGLIAAGCAVGHFYLNHVITREKDAIIRENIGFRWKPLTVEQIAALAEEAAKIPMSRIQIMYENEQGKELARAIADAFGQAGWEVKLQSGGGFGQGISVGGSGSTSSELKAAIDSATPYEAKEYGPGSAVHIGVGINPN